MRPTRIISVIGLLALLAGVPGLASAHGTPPTEAARMALEWLKTQQQADGGFGNGASGTSDVTVTAQTILAGTAAGEDVSVWQAPSGKASPLDFLAGQVRDGSLGGAGEVAWAALAFAAAGVDPAQLEGHDLPAELDGAYRAEAQLYGAGPGESSLAILALGNLERTPRAGAVDGLMAARLPDGSWSVTGPEPGDPVTTALGVMALVSAGRSNEIGPSLDYLRQAQHEDAGWSFEPAGQRSQAGATAFVIMALNASGQDLEEWNDPVDLVLDLQTLDHSFLIDAYTPGSDPMTAAVAITALHGHSLTHLTRVPASAPPSGSTPLAGQAGGDEPGLGLSPAIWFALVVVAALLISAVWFARLRRSGTPPG